MNKKRSLGRRKNIFGKKKTIGFLPGHPSFELTRRVDWFPLAQLQG
jgi:hypothetical protein